MQSHIRRSTFPTIGFLSGVLVSPNDIERPTLRSWMGELGNG
jgi:hypothetical protein